MTNSAPTTPDPEDLFAAWAERVESGTTPDFEALVAAHPQHADTLRSMHADWQLFAPLLERVVPGLIASDLGLGKSPLAQSQDDEPPTPVSPELVERLKIRVPDSARYRFRAVLGRGGGGVVLKVWDTKLDRALAMKVVLGRGEREPTGETPPVDAALMTRFVDEARIASQLDHPSIVPVHELGVDATGRAYFTMRLVRGEDLFKVFEHVRAGREGWTQVSALGVLAKACEAVAYAHAKGVVHRDLKPANVMVGRHGEVHVMDWGLARVLGSTVPPRSKSEPVQSGVRTFRRRQRDETPESPMLTGHGRTLGTPPYMPPEQARGEVEKVDARSDVYAIGVMLYELLAGQAPFVMPRAENDAFTLVQRIIDGPPKPLLTLARSAPVPLIAIVERAMARDPVKRYQDVRALGADLTAFLEGRVVSAHEVGTWAETKNWVRRNRGLAASVGALIVALGFGVTVTTKLARDEAAARAEADERREEAVQASYAAAIQSAQIAQRHNEPATLRRQLNAAPEKLRNWEWKYLHAMSDSSLLVLEGHCAAFSPDGTSIVAASWDYAARVWNAATGREITPHLGHTSTVIFAAFSDDGTRILTTSLDHTVRVWDASTGKTLVPLVGHTEWVSSAAFSSDGTRIVTASSDLTARVWNAATGTELTQLVGHKDAVISADFSPDGTRIVTTSLDDTTRIWNTDTGSEVAPLVGHRLEVTSAAFSPDGLSIVTASSDATARLWDAATGKELVPLVGHTKGVSSARFNNDGTRIVTASVDGTARVWDAATGREIASLVGHADRVYDGAFNPDGTRIATASGDGTARVWNATSGTELARLAGHSSRVRSSRFSSDGKRIVTTSSDGTVRIWDAATGGEGLPLVGHTLEVTSAAFSPDGTRIVTASWDETARLWDAVTGRELAALVGHTNGVSSAAFSPDGSRIVTASADGTARVWDAATGRTLAPLGGHSSTVYSAAFSPDGSCIVTASADDTARVWDAATAKELASLVGHTSSVYSAAFSADGTLIVTASGDDTARVWDAATRRELAPFVERMGTARAAAFSPDGMCIVTASWESTARIWDAATGRALTLLDGHTDVVNSATFSPEGTRILTASDDRTARVWDAATGRELTRLEGHNEPVNLAAFSPDGTRIVTASDDGTARIWDSVPYHQRWREREDLHAAGPAAERKVAELLARGISFSDTAAELRADVTIGMAARTAAMNVLTLRAQAARDSHSAFEASFGERTWIARLAGLEPWPSVTTADGAASGTTDASSWNQRAWTVVDPDARQYGRESDALAFAQRASIAEPSSCMIRDTLARALYCVGRFDEALEEQRRALADAPEDEKRTYSSYLQRLDSDIAALRDEQGQLRTDTLRARIAELDRRIVELEDGVRLWQRELQQP